MKIYVASSWRNNLQPGIVSVLRDYGHIVYDFRNPEPGDTGFQWSDIDAKWQSWTVEQYIVGLGHPLAKDGFRKDYDAMRWADACVLVMPCGRSAHLEAGWFAGAGKPLLILATESEPELMYKMADSIHAGVGSLISRLGRLPDDMRRRTVRKRAGRGL